MALPKLKLLTFVTIALMATGCMRFNNNTSAYPAPGGYSAAPASQVIQSELPPPVGTDLNDPNNAMPPMTGMDGTNTMTPPPMNASATAISPEAVSGVWRASVNGMTCQIATPQTKFGDSYRAGPLHCPTALGGIRSWGIVNNQLIFYDQNGGSVATLYSSGNGFSGRTATGEPVNLSR